MRFFIALELPQSSRNQLREVQQNIKKLIPQAKLTDNDKLHITITFIGDQPDEFKESLIQIIKTAVQGISPFNLTPSYIDGFPNIHNPNILWVGVKGDIDKLIIITERIRDGLRDYNLDVDQRRFVPHIAIAKLRNFHTEDSIEHELQTMIFGEFNSINVTSIKLFESIPDEGFHKHNTLAEIPLI
jgi:2'-5' RNA ligase